MEVINNSLLINEGNVIELFRKLNNKETIDQEEIDAVTKRFRKLAGLD